MPQGGWSLIPRLGKGVWSSQVLPQVLRTKVDKESHKSRRGYKRITSHRHLQRKLPILGTERWNPTRVKLTVSLQGFRETGSTLNIQGGQERLMEKVGLKGVPKNEKHLLDHLGQWTGRSPGWICIYQFSSVPLAEKEPFAPYHYP